MKPVKSRKPFNSFRVFLPLVTGILFFSGTARGIHFPDTLELLKDYRVLGHKNGMPSDFFRRQQGDSASIHLEWAGSALSSIRYEQSQEFDPDSFSVLVSEYGGGAAWHEYGSGRPDSASRKKFPGLQQQWLGKGYAGEKGWVGSGVERGRYFLVFQENALGNIGTVDEPLRLGLGLFRALDSSSEWLHVPCKETKKGSHPVCFTPSDNGKLRIQIENKSPISLDIWLQEEESGSLLGIQQALKTISDDAQFEYAQDLSQMLLGESQIFLVKISQRIPAIFNWPSWQLQDFKEGRIPRQEYLELLRQGHGVGDSLPAFRFKKKGSLQLNIELYFNGLIHLRAEILP
jgi:hypothetical protein